MNTNDLTFHAMTDIVVIGTNPECADYGNPSGDIFGHAAYVVAEDHRGERVRLFIKSARYEEDALPQAQRQAEALTARFARGMLPIAFDCWTSTYPAYGSPAFSNDEMHEWEVSLEQA
jgi:hypothetical protein